MLLPVNTTSPGELQLPIFRQDTAAYSLFYTPGYLTVVARALADDFVRSSAAFALRHHAQAAVRQREETAATPFTPVCLTLYLNNECNLRCPYCYTDPSPHPAPRLERDVVRAAARLVAANCRRRQRPFTIVCHGGGEPTLDQPYLDAVLAELEQIAGQQGVPVFRYVATNGVMTAEKARWLARRFDLIGLSCDGPETIQVRQRPLWGGQSSTPYVEHTARLIHQQDTPLHVRVTITRQSFSRQTEIAHYLCSTLQPDEIHVEPVYQAGRAAAARLVADNCLSDADHFVDEFLKAQSTARQYGVNWLMSGSRLDETHGPYCHIFRDVLNLVPGGTATACFKLTRGQQVKERGMQIGAMDGDGRFHLDPQRINTLRQTLHAIPQRCQDCFNQYHCVQDCPDHCPLDGSAAPAATFRCQTQKKLALTTLQTLAESLWTQARQKDGLAAMEMTRR